MFKRKPKSTVPTDTIVTGDGKGSQGATSHSVKGLRSPKLTKRFAVVLGVVLVVAIVAPLTYMYTQKVGWFRKSAPTQPVIDPNATPAEVNEAITTARAAELDQLISDEDNPDKKREYQNELSLIYLQQGKHDQALDLAKAVEASGQSAISAAALADVYMANEQYDLAAQYYGVAMERSPKPSRPTERAPYNDYANMKKEAEAAQR